MKFRCERDTLAEAVATAQRAVASRTGAMSSEGLELSAIAQDVGEAHESVEAKFDGGELIVAFNAQFLLDGIEAAGSSDLVLETVDPLKPAVLRNPGSTDFLYLLMPVRIA